MEALDNAEAVSRLIAVDASAGDYVDLANPRRVSRAARSVRPERRDAVVTRRRPPAAAAVREYRGLWPVVGIGVVPAEAFPGASASGLRPCSLPGYSMRCWRWRPV